MADKAWSKEGLQGESGLYRTFIITVASSRYEVPEKYDNPVWVLKGEIELPDGTRTDSDIRLSCGEFEKGDAEGTYVVHSSGDDRKMSEQSSAMKFIKTAAAFPELLEALQSRSRVVDGVDLESRDLSIWEGLRLSIDHYQEERTNPKTQVKKMADQPKIVGFLGTVDNPSAASGATGSTSGGQNGALDEAAAKALAKSADSFMDYREKLLKQHNLMDGPFTEQSFFDSARS